MNCWIFIFVSWLLSWECICDSSSIKFWISYINRNNKYKQICTYMVVELRKILFAIFKMILVQNLCRGSIWCLVHLHVVESLLGVELSELHWLVWLVIWLCLHSTFRTVDCFETEVQNSSCLICIERFWLVDRWWVIEWATKQRRLIDGIIQGLVHLSLWHTLSKTINLKMATYI